MFTFLIIGVIITMVVYFFKKYAVGLVKENSMLPTLKDGEIILIKKKFSLKKGRMYIFVLEGESKAFVKRLDHINYSPFGEISLYFLGDNPDESYDSREFGSVQPSSVLGEVIKIWRK